MSRHATVRSCSRIERPVSVAFIGAGNVLWAYLQTVERLIPTGEAVLGGIYARNPRRRAEIAMRRPGTRLFNDLDELWAADIDVIVVITPPDSHGTLAQIALRSGKHVLVEKPLAATAIEARKLMALASRLRRWLVCAPFVHLSPTFGFLAQQIKQRQIGRVHTARGLYGNSGSHWADWYHRGGGGPLADLGIYNMKTLTALLGPVHTIFHQEAHSGRTRRIGGRRVAQTDPDTAHTLFTHRSGATSLIVSSHAIVRYERPALEFYGSAGTINLRGDDWDPRGVDVFRERLERWECYAPIEPTWHWTDGLADLVRSLRENRAPIADLGHDIHLIELLAAAQQSRRLRRPVQVRSTWQGSRQRSANLQGSGHGKLHGKSALHDHTRPAADQ